MKAKALLIFSLSVLLFAACKDKEGPKTNFDITFNANYDNVPLDYSTAYPYDGYPVKFSRFSMFLSDITLLKGSEETVIKETEYILFNGSTLHRTYTNVPEGDYTGIRLNFGVKPSNNAKKPADFATDSPLYDENEYWPGWKSYIFLKIEGKANLDGDNIYEHNLSYHCGSDPVYRSVTFNQHIHVAADATALPVTFDLKKIFTMDDGRLYNMITSPKTSDNRDSIRVALDLMNRIDEATTVGAQ